MCVPCSECVALSCEPRRCVRYHLLHLPRVNIQPNLLYQIVLQKRYNRLCSANLRTEEKKSRRSTQ